MGPIRPPPRIILHSVPADAPGPVGHMDLPGGLGRFCIHEGVGRVSLPRLLPLPDDGIFFFSGWEGERLPR